MLILTPDGLLMLLDAMLGPLWRWLVLAADATPAWHSLATRARSLDT